MAMPVLGETERSDRFFPGGDFALRTVAMKTVQNLQLNLRKENAGVHTLILRKTLPKKLIFYRVYNMDEENEYSPSIFFTVVS